MISFKEYLESKNVLKEAIDTPKPSVTVYEMNKYCKLPVSILSEKQQVSLKPKQMLEILAEPSNPSKILSITVESEHNKVKTKTTFKPFWSSERVTKWIDKNTNPTPDSNTE